MSVPTHQFHGDQMHGDGEFLEVKLVVAGAISKFPTRGGEYVCVYVLCMCVVEGCMYDNQTIIKPTKEYTMQQRY